MASPGPESQRPPLSLVEESAPAPAPAETAPETGNTSTAAAQYGLAIEAGNTIDVDDDGYDNATLDSSTTSISSSIMAHVWENGRRYNKFREGQYALPNDENEQNREDMKHAMMLLLCDGALHYAPIGDHPQNIIDLGTGTGIWALDIADQYPSASVVGVDLSPIQPNWVAPNAKFVVDDIEDAWLYPPDHFDLVHLRVMMAHIRDQPNLFDQCYKHIKPGQWIEIQDHENIPYCDDGSMPEDYAVKEMLTFGQQAMANLGYDTTAVLTVDEKLRAAGFINVTRTVYKLPVGPWPRSKSLKALGLFWRAIILEGVQGIAMGTLGRGLKWSHDDIEVYLVGVRNALMDPKIHTYWPYHIVTGQKPPKE